MSVINTTQPLHAGRFCQRLEEILPDIYQELKTESQRLVRRFKKNFLSSLLELQQQEEPCYTMNEAREMRRRREDAVELTWIVSDPATESSYVAGSHKRSRKSLLNYAMASLFFEQWSNSIFKHVYGLTAQFHRMKRITQRIHSLWEKVFSCVEADRIFYQPYFSRFSRSAFEY